DGDVRGAGWISRMLNADDRGIEPEPRRLAGTIERAEGDTILPYRVDRTRTREGVGDERLHHQSRESSVAVGEHLVPERGVAVFGKLVLDRVITVRRQHVGTETISSPFDRRQKLSHGLATDIVSRHQVVFERDGVELSRDSVAFGLWSRHVDAVRLPAQQLRLHALTDRRAFQPSS